MPSMFMLAHEFDHEKHDPTGWLMSEKFDGVRAWWNGRQLITRRGTVVAAPSWFLEGFPDIPLDGELWGGRGLFNESSGIVRSKRADHRWMRLTYQVFDAPCVPGGFVDRMLVARAAIKDATYALEAEQTPCESY